MENQFVCNHAFTNPWACVHCPHSRPHTHVPARVSTSTPLMCDETSNICVETGQVYKCVPVEDKDKIADRTPTAFPAQHRRLW
jgi:hypothetical protein